MKTGFEDLKNRQEEEISLKKKEEEKELQKVKELTIDPDLKVCEICETAEEVITWEDKECTNKFNTAQVDPALNCKCFHCTQTERLNPYCSKAGDPAGTIHWICKLCFKETDNKKLNLMFQLWNCDAEIPKENQKDKQKEIAFKKQAKDEAERNRAYKERDTMGRNSAVIE